MDQAILYVEVSQEMHRLAFSLDGQSLGHDFANLFDAGPGPCDGGSRGRVRNLVHFESRRGLPGHHGKDRHLLGRCFREGQVHTSGMNRQHFQHQAPWKTQILGSQRDDVLSFIRVRQVNDANGNGLAKPHARTASTIGHLYRLGLLAGNYKVAPQVVSLDRHADRLFRGGISMDRKP